MQFLRSLIRRAVGRRKTPALDPARIAIDAFARLQSGDPAGAMRLLSTVTSGPHADVVFVRGLVHKANGEHATAAQCFRNAVELRQDFAAAWSELGDALGATGNVDSAAVALARAAALEPGSAAIQQNLGRMRYRARDVQGAVDALERAIALDPQLAEAHFNLADALLAAGDFERGWTEYEWRPQGARLAALPRWSEERAGRVAVVAEQGLGDLVMFARLLPRLRSRGARVSAFVPAALQSLLENAQLAEEVHSGGTLVHGDIAGHDACVPFMSLAHVVDLRADEIDGAAYLAGVPEDVARWRARLGPSTGSLRVGVAWAGNPAHDLDFDRSIPLSALAPLSKVSGVSLYSLQLGGGNAAAPFPLIDFTEHLTDLAQTAAFIMALDLVIAVDTAVAHLAGALGAPVWVLCPYRADWRWDIAGRESPWYASARIFRATSTAQWSRTIDDVSAALADRARIYRTV